MIILHQFFLILKTLIHSAEGSDLIFKSFFQIVENVVQVLYNLGDGNKVLQMVNVTAADGFWHTLYFQRRGRSIVLAQDGKEGPMYVETTTDSKHQELTVRQTQIYAGAEVSYDHSKKIDQTNPKDLENCE